MIETRKELLQTLAEKMASIMRRVHSGQGFRFNEFVLRPPQIRVLFLIASQNEEVSVKDLAEMLNVTPGAITQFVDSLVEMDLVRRKEDASDRRVIRIKLTETAKGKLEELKKGYLESVNRVFKILGNTEIRELIRLLDKVDTHQEQRKAKDDFKCG